MKFTKKMSLKIEAYASAVLETLTKNGYESYLVGGCVRDCIMGINPSDYDITTIAKPSEIKQLFPHSYPKGERFGTVSVVTESGEVEVTTYRTESGYSDFRRPDKVLFSTALEDDLSRRDFTINALCYDGENVCDFFSGIEDINNQIIRTVGEPEKRFTEDALRIMRAYRFACVYGFSIEELTKNAAEKCRGLLVHISGERVFNELSKILMSKHTGLLSYIMSTFFGWTIPQPGKLHAISGLDKDLKLRFAALFILCSFDERSIRAFCATYKASVDFCRDTIKIVKCFYENGAIIRKLNAYDESSLRKSIDINKMIFGRDMSNQHAELKEIIDNKYCYKRNMLAVCGDELMECTNLSGRKLGELINRLLISVMDDPALNEKSTLLALARRFKD